MPRYRRSRRRQLFLFLLHHSPCRRRRRNRRRRRRRRCRWRRSSRSIRILTDVFAIVVGHRRRMPSVTLIEKDSFASHIAADDR